MKKALISLGLSVTLYSYSLTTYGFPALIYPTFSLFTFPSEIIPPKSLSSIFYLNL